MKKISAAPLAIPLLASMLAASMLLAGCGGYTKPSATPPSTATSSPTTTAATPKPTPTNSASPTASPKTDPNIPAAARGHSIAGAEAFVKYFFERLNVAWTVPRAGILSPLCQPSAIACTAFERDATRLAKEGHRYDGNPVSVEFIGTLDATNANKYDVLANVVQERRSEIDAAGKTYVTDKRKKLRFNFELLYSGHAWSIASINLMK